jgi:SH3-like domain-containing protein
VNFILAVLLNLVLSSCNSSAPKSAAISSEFAGPLSLNLRKDLGPKAPVVATLKHGDQVEVLERRRRFVRVRTAEGIEGWTDQNLLITQKQMSGLKWLADASKRFPSQGAATVYDTLNLHVEPNRQSPSFYQITEGMTVDILDHRVTMHHDLFPESDPAPTRRAVVPRKKSPKDKNSKDKDKKDSWQPLADLPPPPVPSNLIGLSRPKMSDLAAPAKPTAPALRAPPTADDWSLVRLKDGKVGWVLARMLNMSLPDDIVQYAEGHRITAFLSLGTASDKTGGKKQHWLWTTQSVGLRPFDFDSFRVFVWSPQRNHYETALIERNVKGFYPIEAHDIPGEDRKSFSIVLEEKDGMLYKRTYAFTGYRVKMTSKVPYQKPADLPDLRSLSFDPPAPEATETGWKDKVTNWWGRVRGKK